MSGRSKHSTATFSLSTSASSTRQALDYAASAESPLAILQRSSHLRRSGSINKPRPYPVSYREISRPPSMNEFAIQQPGHLPLTSPCTQCVTDCTDSSCSALQMQEGCTKQCIVVCHDSDHANIKCFDGATSFSCGLQCDDLSNCTSDCHEFEDFLQCCSEPASYLPTTAAFTLDPIIESWLCSCPSEQHPVGIEQRSPAPVASDPTVHMRSSSISSSPTLDFSSPPELTSVPIKNPPSFTLQDALFSPELTPVSTVFPSTEVPTQTRSDTFSCMWGDCHASFTSPSELIDHVNFQHLRSAILPAPPRVDVPPSPQQQPNNLSCLWRDCHLYPSPELIPGPSSGNPFDAALTVLASHLFHDHLGLSDAHSYLSLAQPTVDPSTSSVTDEQMMNAPSSSPPISIPSELSHIEPHNCTVNAHICRWKSCGEKFDSCDDLTAHLTAEHVGSGKARYECHWEGCDRHGDRGFSSKQKICRHLQAHTGHRPFQCEVCQQYFSEAATLQQHMRRHTREKPFKCSHPGCGKSFATAGALTIHKRTHNGEKPFKCPYCDRAFAESSNLSKHIRTHTGVRPYACGVEGCNKSFARPDQLARHMGIHRRNKVANDPKGV